MAKRTRIGKKLSRIEALFGKLPKAHKTEEVFILFCEAAGVSAEKARAHFALALALIGGGR